MSTRTINIIDADSLFYAIGWKLRDCTEEFMGPVTLDACLASIRATTGTDNALLCIGSDEGKCFRYSAYKYAPYKGTRTEKPEYFTRWEPIIRKHMIQEYKAVCVKGLEADDLIAMAAGICRRAGVDYIISSGDKDALQIPGCHLNHTKIDTERGAHFQQITEDQAQVIFWLQMLTGDTQDNVKGVPGVGDAKARPMIESVDTVEELPAAVLQQYRKYFGDYYGPIIFDETYRALYMLHDPQDAYDYDCVDKDQLEEFVKYVKDKSRDNAPALFSA
jgi:5'-3' exonuclease